MEPPELPTDVLSPSERLYGLSLLWREAADHFAYFDQVPQLDWDALYRSFIPQVLEADSLLTCYRLLLRFVAHLQDGHSYVRFPPGLSAVPIFTAPPVRLRAVGRSAYVENVARELETALPVGSVITRVGGRSVAEVLEMDVFPFITASTDQDRWRRGLLGHPVLGYGLLMGEAGSDVQVEAQGPDGELRTVNLIRSGPPDDADWELPPPAPLPVTGCRWLGDGRLYLALNTFNDPAALPEFLSHLPELRAARAVVLDLRRNSGGDGSVALEVARHLRAEPFLAGAWRSRQVVSVYRAWGRFADQVPALEEYSPYAEGTAWHEGAPEEVQPVPNPVTCPVVVLTGAATFSAAEDLLVLLDGARNVTRVGSATGGSTGQPLVVPLPGGGAAGICCKRDTFPDGRVFVGAGILPGVEVRETVEAARAGQDEVLAAALRLLDRSPLNPAPGE